MPRFRMLALILVALFLFLLVPFPQARGAMDRPVWTVGDFWTYAIVGGAFGTEGSGRVRYEVLGTGIVTVGGFDYTSYHTKVELNITSGSLTFNVPGEAWFRTSDLAPVKMALTIEFEVPPVTLTSTTTITYDPPLAIEWPLTEGRSWSVTSVVTTAVQQGGQPPTVTTATFSAQYTVQEGGTVAVPAGTFSTIAVRQTESEGDYDRSYYSPEAGNAVKQESFDVNDQEQGSLELRSYRYAAAAFAAGTFLGLPVWAWALFALVAIIAIFAVVLLRRKRPSAPVAMPAMPPQEPAPPAPPPTSPP